MRGCFRLPLFLSIIIGFILFLPWSATGQTGRFAEGELLVQLHPGMEVSDLRGGISSIDLTPVKQLSRRMNIWLCRFNPREAAPRDALQAVRRLPAVQRAQFNHYVSRRSAVFPNDPQFGSQWALDNTGQTGGTPDADIDAPEAWDIATGGTTSLGDEIVVAVIDGGIDLNHVDLNLWKNVAEIPGNGLDDDGNGYVDDYDGWNAFDSNGDLPGDNHGTHVAGIVGATGNNATGVSGVTWNAKVMPVAGAGNLESIVVEAYGYVLEMRALYNETNGAAGAFVVATNASFGIDFGDPADFPLWCAIYDSLGAQGILNCAATANLNINVDLQGDVPTGCPSEYLIGVTNTTHTDQKNSLAAYGPTSIDLGAPGTSVLSTLSGNLYGNLSGTSMASPHVAGAIALMFSAAAPGLMQQYKNDPAATALLFRQFLLDGVDPIPALNGITVTGGRLNVFNSVQRVQQHITTNFGLSPLSLDFGETEVGAGDTLTVYVSNATADSAAFSVAVDAPAFVPQSNSVHVAPQSFATLEIYFQPPAAGHFSGILTVSNADTSMTAGLNGSGIIFPQIAVSATALNFSLPENGTGSQNFTIENHAPVGGQVLSWLIVEQSASLANLPRRQGGLARQSFAELGGKNPVTVPRPIRPEPSGRNGRIILFQDDMESGTNGWTTAVLGGTVDDLWHQTIGDANSAVTSWWCARETQGNYQTGNRILNALVSPEIDLSNAIAPLTLEFAENYNTEAGWDFCNVEISTNGGVTWTSLRSGVAGNSNGWVTAQLDLSPFAGQMIRLRFLFDTTDNIGNDFPGWHIDDVTISDANTNVISWLAAEPAAGDIPAGGSVEVTVSVDAAGLPAGNYSGILQINSNDPDRAVVNLPVSLTVGTAGTADFAAKINVSDNSSSADLEFGTAPDATSGFDAAYDVLAPPVPSPGVFDARFRVAGADYLTDFRTTNPGVTVWELWVQPSETGGTVLLGWDPSLLAAEGSFHLTDTQGGGLVHVDMRSQNAYADTLGLGRFSITFTRDTTVTQTLFYEEGWRLVGVPLQPLDAHHLSLFPESLPGSLFGFEGTYVARDSLRTGRGYWLRFTDSSTVHIAGLVPSGLTVSLGAGWNLISGLSCAIAVDDIIDPAGLIIPGTIWGFDGAYFEADTLFPGRGYWVNTTAAGEIFLDCNTAVPASVRISKSAFAQPDWPALVFRNPAGLSQTLYLENAATRALPAEQFLLPPAPPQAALDVRCKGDTRLIGESGGRILLRSAEFPVQVEMRNLPGTAEASYRLQAYRGKAAAGEFHLRSGMPVIIADPAITELHLVPDRSLYPGRFRLAQNFPNPFNPGTEIRYELPVDSRVILTIFNALGQKVRTLVNRDVPAGYHSATWDATNDAGEKVASGIYLLHFQAKEQGGAKNFTAAGKMMLLK